MPMNHMPLPEPRHEQHPGTVLVQDQQAGQEGEDYFLIQVAKRARQEWETFHSQYPDVDEETFCQAYRFCLKQWVLQNVILLRDLPAFQRAQRYVERELRERAAELQDTAMMLEYTYREARAWSVRLATQAQERSQQLREATEELSNSKVPYLVGKINKLRAPGQAQEREKEAEAYVRRMRRDNDIIKKLGIVRDYENQKGKLEKHEKEVVDQLNAARHLMRESQLSAQTAAGVTHLEAHVRNFDTLFDTLVADLHLNTLAQYHGQDEAGTMPSDWDVATQQTRDVHDTQRAFAGFVGGIQAAITAALTKAKAAIEQAKYTHHHLQKVNTALQRMRKRRAAREQWTEKEMKKVERRKKQHEKLQAISINMMIQASNDLFGNEGQLLDALERARSMTTQAMETLETISRSLIKIKASQICIAQKEGKAAHALENVKAKIDRFAHIAKNYAQDAKQASDLQKEMAAYIQAKSSLESAIQYSQEIALEYRNVQEAVTLLEKHLTALLQGYLCWEKEVLQSAITGVKDIVKASLHAIQQEQQVQETACQRTTVLQRGGDDSLSRETASEQEALLLAAFANDALAQCATSYRIFHQLAAEVAKDDFEIRKDHWQDCLDVVKTYLDEIKPEKERQKVPCQRASSRPASQAHLLINEQTGAVILKGGVVAFFLQDLAGIEQADLQETPRQSRLVFKDGHLWSNCDVPHNQLHESCEQRTSICLQVPDGMGGQVAMLSLPNGTQIHMADIDFGETEYDPARPECGVTIALKKDGGKINLLAAAFVMTETLKPEELQEQMDKSLDDNINRIRDALGTKSLEAIYEAFQGARGDDLYRKYIDTFLLSSEKAERRVKDQLAWMESIVNIYEEIVCKIYEYASDVLNQEKGEKEITDAMILENLFLDNMPRELYQKRQECLQKIEMGKDLDTIINCSLVDYTESESAAMNLSLNGQEALAEYERTQAWQRAIQWRQDPATRSLSDQWSSYLGHLRRAILEQAPAYYRTRFLVDQIKAAVEADHWEEGTAENPGVISLAQDLAQEPSVVGRADSQGDNSYGRTMDALTERIGAGIQDAVKTACPSEILSRVRFLDLVYAVIDFNEVRVADVLGPTASTVVARAVMEQISGIKGRGIQDPGMIDQRERKER